MAVVAGERRIVTVLFADIVGSTAISERLGAERLSLLVNEVMRVMSAEVERFDGTVASSSATALCGVRGSGRPRGRLRARGPSRTRDPACARAVRKRCGGRVPGRARGANRNQHRPGRHQVLTATIPTTLSGRDGQRRSQDPEAGCRAGRSSSAGRRRRRSRAASRSRSSA